MTKKDFILLFVLALVFYSLFAMIQKEPGYMDAEYYFGQALRIAQGKGLSEPFIWNFLANPQNIPIPGFGFWMPLTSFLSAAMLWITHSDSFYVARIPFIIAAAALPLISASLAYRFSSQKRAAWLAGGITIASGYYLPYITITDNFLPYMFLGGLLFLTINQMDTSASTNHKTAFLSIVAGLIVGLLSLTRSDGVIWVIPTALSIWLSARSKKVPSGRMIGNLSLLVLGFGLIFAPWMMRNYSIYHAFLPPSNRSMLWLTSYNDLFVYPSNSITLPRFLSTGITNILLDRLRALGSNLQTLVASGGNIILFPLILLGWWKYRKESITRTAMAAFLLILFVMSIVFPYAGERGGFFHSLSSLQLFLWALVPVGLDSVIQWGIRYRKWNLDRSWRMFGTTAVVISFCLSLFLANGKIRNGVENGIPWNRSSAVFLKVETVIQNTDQAYTGAVMTNDPPGHYLYTGRTAVMIPTGGADAILSVAELFHVKYLVLDEERQEVKTYFTNFEQLQESFELVYDKEGLLVYEYQP